ncbi:50S ribosomal protein L6 [Psychrobacter sp.]|uniref:50S ribosomal protein L6 n=1 Tax=Psychrobacter sp. TaxID=56811 RepID=UPI0026478107|nr:50S ribosomal protein L6 [Psychrobacter sp.]MDN6275134.1 50S ribosomal protein L6 [Psychrobacter sp.]MDN6307387.1 50S ribosomal protein L6 [Psychrobacter sp.]
MSRVAKAPVTLPNGVSVTLNDRQVEVKGKNGSMSLRLHALVELKQEDDAIIFSPTVDSKEAMMHTGTMRALLNNYVTGVSVGFERRLQLIGVGYRAQSAGDKVTLNVGYSHPVEYTLPEGVTAETPTQTEIVLKSSDKQKLGQAAANIRGFRPPEPYKGKGIRYSDEHVVRKEAKKK